MDFNCSLRYWRFRRGEAAAEGLSRANVRTPCPGAGTDRPILSAAIVDPATMPYIGSPIDKASSPVVSSCIPQPCDSTNPARDFVIGRDISWDRRPFANSLFVLTVAFIVAKPYASSSW